MLNYRSDGLRRFAFLVVLSGLVLLLFFIVAVPVQSVQAAPPQDTPAPASNSVKTYLPFLSKLSYIAHETYPIDWAGGTITALNGRAIFTFPQGAVNYPGCVLHVLTNNQQAEELALKIYIPCQVNQGEDPYYFSEFNVPVTITMDYVSLDLTYTDEMRLGIVYDNSVQSQSAAVASLGLQDAVVDPVAKTVSGTIKGTGGFKLARNYTLTDLNSGPGGAYAAAAPIVYTVQSGKVLTRFLNLDEIDPAGDLMHNFDRFAVNPASGEVYLALQGKSVGSAVNVYAVNGTALRRIYQLPADETIWDLTYRPGDDLLYLSMTSTYGYWFGCPMRHIWVRVIKASDGSLVGDDLAYGGGINRGLIGLSVNSDGRLLAGAYDPGCFPSEYSGATLVSAQANTPSALLSGSYMGFRGIGDLASGSQGRTYVANTTADMISVVAGAQSEVVGAIDVPAPSRITIAGNTLYVLSNGKIITRSAVEFAAGGKATLMPSATLSASDLNIQVTGSFSRVPAHNVIYYNGVRFGLSESADYDFTGQEQTLTYAIVVPQPPMGLYIPLDQQSGTLTFKINGVIAANQSVKAPQMHYKVLDVCNNYEREVTVARGEWLMLYNVSEVLGSEQGLFPDTFSHNVLMRFEQVGEFDFTGSTGGELQSTLKVTVTPFGAPDSAQAVIDPAQGGVLWAGSTAFEIPPGALPANPGGFTVTLSTQNNSYPIQGEVNDRSLIQKFSFTPEVTQLNSNITLHIPRNSADRMPIMAFYDPVTNDPFPIDSSPDETMSTHVKVILPAGSYPASTVSAASATAQPLAASQPTWFRRGLNWLGTTGLWHAVGLPNDKMITDHFVLLFNTNDCSDSYAGNLLDALETGYAHFKGMGYAMPAEAVYVKVAPWVASTSTPGVTPGIGSLFHFYIFMNNALPLETLQDTAVHEFFHVLQKTNATPDGRYMNPVWWEEATAIWSQYEVYPAHTGYYITDIHADNGQIFLRTPVDHWPSMPVEQMNAAMSIAAYLQENYGQGAVLATFTNLQFDWGVQVGVQKSIEMVTGKSFGNFYADFAKDYWQQKFEPVKSWTFIDNITDPNLSEMNAIYPLSINQAVNTIVFGDIPQLSSGMYKIYAPSTGVPPSFTDTLASGSVARLKHSCTGMAFYFFDGNGNPINDLTFDGASEPPFNEGYYDKRLGQLTHTQPLYLLYIDKSYGYDANCSPVIELEQPTPTIVTPNAVVKNRTVDFTLSGDGFGDYMGSLIVGGETVTPTFWSNSYIGFTWFTGTWARNVSVAVIHKKGAIGNRLTITIND